MAANKKPSREGNSGEAGKNGMAEDMLKFINYSWTQFHAVEDASRRLAAVGFRKISERQAWELRPGGRYYFTRNLSTLVAFAVGAKYQPGNGFHMLGAHTDSPCLKLKPISKSTKSGYEMVNVEPYGGGLWHTWFDRDLTVAGRVLVKEGDQLVHKLVKIEKPILRIPMLAIHLQRDLADQGFKPNKQTHLAPLLSMAVKSAAEKLADKDKSSERVAEEGPRHQPLLLRLIAEHLGCSPSAIVDFELNVCDTQPGVIGGAEDEFVFVGRLDNLAMSFCSVRALADTYPDEASLANEAAVKAIALFDHEEVGSASAQGAGGPVMRDTITRVAASLAQGEEGAVVRALQQSFLVSADMAHAVHPNYADRHEPQHQPQIHKGLVLKHNVNQRYATNLVSAVLFRECARRRGIPTQEFSVKSDMACGSTIGPILSSGLGCRTVDVGAPQLAMHSIREMCGTQDIQHAYDHFVAFFEDFSALDASLDIDSLPPANVQGSIADTPCGHVH
ncbi:hypothetical protein WJX72_008629 [[Myrmecia] bisecta]|uniref:aspartyl aminopeptidase n=1 Tax=[Myrmecia] bisecta TaxID=41462 RepID=A0AAW1QSZ0_9CHLO